MLRYFTRLVAKIQNSVLCANCQHKGTFLHELSIQYCTIIYLMDCLTENESDFALKAGDVSLSAFYRPVKALLKCVIVHCVLASSPSCRLLKRARC